jgi:hypothetical protein
MAILFDRGPSSDRHARATSIPTWNFNFSAGLEVIALSAIARFRV